jgi:uncharacterized Fe-S center protein
MIPKVLHCDALVTKPHGGPYQKFQKLLEKSRWFESIREGERVAVKMHFGEPGNIRYIRPIWATLVVDALKKGGAKPFLCDTTVLYASPRRQADTYLQVAYRHGFHPEVVGCPVVIAGGEDDPGIDIEVPEYQLLPKVRVSRIIWEADRLMSLAHATLHLQFPMAASLKNIGMGCAVQVTKKAMHGARGREEIYLSTEAATLDGAKVVIRKFSGKFLAINIAMDITPDCDCWNKTELPVVPDQGIFISEDPVAADRAVNDFVIAAPAYPGSKADGNGDTKGLDKSERVYSGMKTSKFWEVVKEAGCGSISYQLEKL